MPYTPKSPGRWPSVPLAYTAQPEYGDRIIGLSTTGVAGPGPDGDKPAGLVYVGLRIPASLTPDHAKCSKPSNSILMACAKRFVASPYSTFCKT